MFFLQNSALSYAKCLSRRNELAGQLAGSPYCLPLRIQLSQSYFHLQYPDLATEEAYKALLLADTVADESDEYHERAREAVEEWLAENEKVDEAGSPGQGPNGEDADSRADVFVKTVCVPTV